MPKTSRFLVGTGELALEDPESGAVYTLKGSDDVAPDHGVALRAQTNPPAGKPLFRVLSAGGAERLRVEHEGAVAMDNDLSVSGSGLFGGDVMVDGAVSANGVSAGGNVVAQGNVVVNGRLQLNEVSTASNGSSGCIRMDEVMQCWGRSVAGDGGNQDVFWAKPFANGNYAVSCTVDQGSDNAARIPTVRGRYTNRVSISVYNANSAKRDDPALCIAIGRGGTW